MQAESSGKRRKEMINECLMKTMFNWLNLQEAFDPRKRSLATDEHGFTGINNWLHKFFVTSH